MINVKYETDLNQLRLVIKIIFEFAIVDLPS